MKRTTPRATLTVDIDVPEEIVAEARARMEATDHPDDLEDYILEYVSLNLNY